MKRDRLKDKQTFIYYEYKLKMQRQYQIKKISDINEI